MNQSVHYNLQFPLNLLHKKITYVAVSCSFQSYVKMMKMQKTRCCAFLFSFSYIYAEIINSMTVLLELFVEQNLVVILQSKELLTQKQYG